jgi:hypothetical protein
VRWRGGNRWSGPDGGLIGNGAGVGGCGMRSWCVVGPNRFFFAVRLLQAHDEQHSLSCVSQKMHAKDFFAVRF